MITQTNIFFLLLLLFNPHNILAQTAPVFGPDIKVAINGLNVDAMEPFISADGSILFFNSLNSGGNTNLYYASRINDSTFNFMGLVNGPHDTSANHLDGVASMDSAGRFFWTSLRNYPTKMENLHTGLYTNEEVSGITRIYGTANRYKFNYPFGWIIMDASINYQGNYLYYSNAKFDFANNSCSGFPCESVLEIAEKVNDSTFNKLTNSSYLLSALNDTVNYLIYAPQLTKDGLELYFTRLKKGTYNTEICVSVRSENNEPFSAPQLIYSKYGSFPEAASPSLNKELIYFHLKESNGSYRIYLKRRLNPNSLLKHSSARLLNVAPNPTTKSIKIELIYPEQPFLLYLYNAEGQEIYKSRHTTELMLTHLPKGVYYLKLEQNNQYWTKAIIKE